MDINLLLGELKQFKEESLKKFDRIEEKIDRLNEFKWRVAGGAAVLSFLLTALVEFVSRIRG